jgi:hypothetical protein
MEQKSVIKKSGKKFKSGNMINTVFGETINPNTGLPAYTFIEDDSVVDQRTCVDYGVDTVVLKAKRGGKIFTNVA